MQIGGVGGEHNASMHQVTKCIHDHSSTQKMSGGAGLTSSNTTTQIQQTELQQEAQFSLSAWMEKALGRGKRLFQSIWGSTDTAFSGEAGNKSENPQVADDDSKPDGIRANVTEQESGQQDLSQHLHTPQIAAAATAVVQPQVSQNNPYFAAIEDTGMKQETLWQKVRVKFKDITGQLTGHLPGKFFNFQAKNSFQAKQEQPKEDMRKRSKYRKDEVEIDCVLTDDSYLLDSYDRKGEYSRLSTKK